MSTKLWAERPESEDAAIRILGLFGWRFVPREELDKDRDSTREGTLVRRLDLTLRKLNPWISTENARKAVRAITHVQAAGLIEANEKIHRTLVHTLSIEQDIGDGRGKIGRDVHFIDFDHPENNEFIVTRQFEVQGNRKTTKFDIALFVNGLLLGVIECKAPTLGEKWFEEAMKSLNRYQEAEDQYVDLGAPRAFETVQVIAALASSAGARLGTILTPARHYSEWRQPYPLKPEALEKKLKRIPTPQDKLIAGALSPEALLDLTANLVAFENDRGRTIKKIARYQQFIAVNRALQRIRTAPDPAGRGGVIWHTQGSGKSLTMLWLAVKLRRPSLGLGNPTIVVVTDRVDLDEQIEGTFNRCGFPNPHRAKSVRDLRDRLASGTGLTIMTTIQKFQDVAQGRGGVLNEAQNLFVLVDEAHRTQYKALAANMRKSLPNACFLGFTGTPIDKQDRSTPRVFGPYIHTYTIQQSVEDRATVPIYYEGRLPDLRVEGETLDAIFDRVFKDRSDKERAAIRNKFATLEAIAAAPQRIERICTDLIKHYEEFIQPNGFKAQVVACSRDAAATYFATLERLNAPPAAILISASHNDPAHLAKHHLSKLDQRRIIDRFKNPADPLAILVVCDMLLTGFDAEVEQVMYLDSPLKEHTLLQAIARVNRTADKKTYGLVVDYWGVSAELQDALAIFDPSDVQGALVEKTDELPRLRQRHQQVMRMFEKVNRKDLESCLRILEPEDRRAEFEMAFRRFTQSMDMVLPDPAGLEFMADLRWLGKLREVARARFRDPGLDLSGCGAKVRKIIEEHVRAEGIVPLVKPVSIFSEKFDEEVAKLRSTEAKASEMEHAIRYEINVRLSEDPVFYQKLSERLEELIQQRREERVKDAEALKRLQQLADEMRSLRKKAESLGLSEDALPFYNLLTDDGDSAQGGQIAEPRAKYRTSKDDPRVLAKEILEALRGLAVIDWTQKDDVQREMRREIKRRLRAAGFVDDRIEPMTGRLMELARARLAR